jgi:hypothetical protein
MSTQGSIKELSEGYSSNVQAAVDYANRQLQQKIKSEMLAKMEKLGEIKPKKKRAKDDDELTIDDDSDRELDDNEKLQMVIDQIWEKYDADNSGSLDMDESRAFVQDILSDVGGDFSEPVFQAMFKSFDEDRSGTLEKEEILNFILKLIEQDA